MSESGAVVDGRTARRDRNREAVLDAALALFAEGDLTPSAAAVADRSGVSLRSVYRYYEDLDELTRAAIARNLERNQPWFTIDGLGEGPLGERIDRFVERRAALYERVAAIARAAVARSRTDARVRNLVERRYADLRAQGEEMFAPELQALDPATRAEAAAALAVASGFEAFEQLRVTLGLTPAEARRVVTRLLHALFAR